MVIFAVAVLAGFLLFGWIESTERPREFFNNPRTRCKLGLLALAVALVALMFPVVEEIIKSMFAGVNQIIEWMSPGGEIEAIQWPEYWVAIIAQRLTGNEAARLILGAVFGCLLRYWGPHFWEMRLRPWTRYNWVAISLVGLLLLAAATPYLERQLGGMTGLKTPFAEFQFEGIARVERTLFEETRETTSSSKVIPNFTGNYAIDHDTDFLTSFMNKKFMNLKRIKPKRISEQIEVYNKSLMVANEILGPLNQCASQAYKNYLDTESVRHALGPVAQSLRLLIQSGPSQNSASEKNPPDPLRKKVKQSLTLLEEALVTEEKDPLRKEVKQSLALLREAIVRDKDTLLKEVEKSLDLLKGAIGKEEEKKKCTLNLQSNQQLSDDLGVLSKAPHIYLGLALLDAFNDNREGGISILKQASERFGPDGDSPGIRFNINFTLARYLYDTEHDPENIFRQLDKALKIAQDTLDDIDKWKQLTTDNDMRGKLLNAERRFKRFERSAKNFSAYFSAEVGARKFEALRYAKENYDNPEKLLLSPPMKSQIIDTYGYVKMAFEAKRDLPDFDEIEQAKALFKEALSHAKNLDETDRYKREYKRMAKKTFESHLRQADRLLLSR